MGETVGGKDGKEDVAATHAVEGLADITDDDAYDVTDEEESGGTRGGGGTYLTDLADALRDGGVTVKEYDGWESRARGSGGLSEGPLGIILHHTASGSSWNGQRDADFLAKTHKYAPISNLYLDRQGTWWVLAAGGSNTNGRGGPWGPIRKNGANSRVIGIEAGNNGLGEPWPAIMQESYVNGVAALAKRYSISTANVISHREWTRRKIDPAGPSRFGTINSVQTWDMDKFREAVDARLGSAATTAPTPAPTPAPTTATTPSPTPMRKAMSDSTTSSEAYVIKPGDTWWGIATKKMGDPGKNWPILAEANGGPETVLRVGAVLTIPGGVGSSAPPAAGPAEFPGEAAPGTKGPVVLAWQEAFIERGVLADTPGNRDSDYGAGMERIVLVLQQSWGWSNADGIAGSGTWRRLHESS